MLQLARGSELVVQSFLLAVRLAVGVEGEHPGGADEPALTAGQVVEGASDGGTRQATPDAARLARQVGLLLLSEPWTGSSSLYKGGWRIGVSRRVRPYVDVADLDGYWTLRTETLRDLAPTGSIMETLPLPSVRMTPVRAIQELQELRDQAASPEVQRNGAEHEAWKAKVDVVMAVSLSQGSTTLSKFRDLRYDIGVSTGADGEADDDARYFASQVARASALIDAAVFELDLQSPDDTGIPANLPVPDDSPDAPIFVVHGRDGGRKHELMRLLDRTTNRDAIVLHEQPNRGATILEKFERHAQASGFAVVLLTGDDEGRLRGDTASLNRRGRQNVILELGVFLGRLGRSHVAVLIDHDVERPSDLDGLVYIPLDPGGAWKLSLLNELDAAGIAVDRVRIP